jgi:hypothetical protein
MRYKNSRDFRQALETRLVNINKETGMPHVRLRKIIAFDRFLARLIQHQPKNWVLKGGFSLQIRLGIRARTTKDIDLLSIAEEVEVLSAFQMAGSLEIGDWFTFETSRSTTPAQEGMGATRYKIRSRLDGRIFEDFHVDVAVGDPMVGKVEVLPSTKMLAFANLQPTRVPCLPISQQIAEKLHAYTRPRKSGANTRVKDFADILLLAEIGKIQSNELREAIHTTFDHASTHELPDEFPSPPKGWSRSYKRIVEMLEIDEITLEESYGLLQKFLNPILRGNLKKKKWNPTKWVWE